ncbi:hypothetical protein EYF80_003701 [Liparis tanakae]|uniref:Uncharacterized protein n=1 Tax=Liparis tanakae TaxID=230148 RepID=A0A4Z2J754_9TELE|nr:hypothetical protein EYF80_003701 [Liparis tanakae]
MGCRSRRSAAAVGPPPSQRSAFILRSFAGRLSSRLPPADRGGLCAGAGADASVGVGARLCWYKSPVDWVMGSKPALSALSALRRRRLSASAPCVSLRRCSFRGRSPVLQAFSECREVSRSTFLARSSFPEELILCSLLGSRPPPPPPPPLLSSVHREHPATPGAVTVGQRGGGRVRRRGQGALVLVLLDAVRRRWDLEGAVELGVVDPEEALLQGHHRQEAMAPQNLVLGVRRPRLAARTFDHGMDGRHGRPAKLRFKLLRLTGAARRGCAEDDADINELQAPN